MVHSLFYLKSKGYISLPMQSCALAAYLLNIKFDSLSTDYHIDVHNHVACLSSFLGHHRKWRKQLYTYLGPWKEIEMMDMKYPGAHLAFACY